jgi:hypothetical protein
MGFTISTADLMVTKDPSCLRMIPPFVGTGRVTWRSIAVSTIIDERLITFTFSNLRLTASLLSLPPKQLQTTNYKLQTVPTTDSRLPTHLSVPLRAAFSPWFKLPDHDSRLPTPDSRLYRYHLHTFPRHLRHHGKS